MRVMANHLKSDIVHTCGSPDFLGVIAKKNCHQPVVHEIFDTYSLYDFDVRIRETDSAHRGLINGPLHLVQNRLNLKWEAQVHTDADALVFTSEEMMRKSLEMYGDFKSIVIPNGVLRSQLPSSRRPKLSLLDGRIHCVYLGAIGGGLAHRMIVPQIREVVSHDHVTLHLYPTTTGAERELSQVDDLITSGHIVVHTPLHYSRLYEELTQYDLGLVLLNAADERLLDVALPNKIFEYAASGLPVAVPSYDSLVNFVSKFSCGFVIEDWSSGIVDNISNIKSVTFRDEFTIDFYLPSLIRLYEMLVS